MSSLAALHLLRWQQGPILPADVDRAEEWVKAVGSQMLTVPGSWRAKVINGSLYVKMLHLAPTWAERTNVLRLFLTVATSGPRLPDVDVVYVHSDQDPAPTFGWPCRSWRDGKGCAGKQLPLLGNAVEHKLLKATLSVPEFSWAGWKRQLPWCHLSTAFARKSAHAPWLDRLDRAYFAGSLENGRWRRRLRALAASEAARGGSDLVVKDVSSDFYHWRAGGVSRGGGGKGGGPGEGMARDPIDACLGYRYALSMPGYGYSNRLRSLLACGCVVLHVAPPWEEYFTPLLQNGVHWVVLRHVKDILPTLRRLRANASHANAIARAGRRIALEALSYPRELDYLRALLGEVARRQHGPNALTPGFTRVRSARDLLRVARLCECRAPVGHEQQHRSRGLECRRDDVCCFGYNCPTTALDCPSVGAEGDEQ